MMNLRTFIPAEFRKPFLDSSLQLASLALIIYGFSFFVGPAMACGINNADLNQKAFECASGQMLTKYKLLIVSGLALASLLAGRAVNLITQQANSKIQS